MLVKPGAHAKVQFGEVLCLHAPMRAAGAPGPPPPHPLSLVPHRLLVERLDEGVTQGRHPLVVSAAFDGSMLIPMSVALKPGKRLSSILLSALASTSI